MLKPHLKGDEAMISMMAGKSVEVIEQKLGSSKVIRVMPNTPSQIGKECNFFYFSPHVTSMEQSFVEELFSSTGELFYF